MIEFYLYTRVDLKTAFPHGPLALRTLTLQGILVRVFKIVVGLSLDTAIWVLRLSIRINQSEKLG
jgi:hypothetical protein